MMMKKEESNGNAGKNMKNSETKCKRWQEIKSRVYK
jgi:hypothetical protein